MSDSANILFTGLNPDNYKEYGNIIHIPLINIVAHRLSDDEVERLKSRFQQYDIILFTSKYAVEHFFNLTESVGIELSKIKLKVFVVIGHNTAASLREKQIEPNLIANIETSEGLFEQMKEEFNLPGQRILFPRSNLPNPYLKDRLTESGCEVDELTVYENIKPEKKDLPDQINAVFFTSPSTVDNFIDDYQSIPEEWEILCKGPVTLKRLSEKGYQGEIVS